MANWASTSYRIEGSKSDLEKVYGVIDDFMTEKQKPVSETASKDWEGNIVKALGQPTRSWQKTISVALSKSMNWTAILSVSRQKRHGEHRISVICCAHSCQS